MRNWRVTAPSRSSKVPQRLKHETGFVMPRTILKLAIVFAIGASLSACNRNSGNGRPLLNLRQSAIAPDEFLVVPQKPLETPADLTSLPAPDPGAEARVTIDFEDNLLRALGGRPLSGGAVPSSDSEFVSAARSNGGATPNIRAVMRAEDQAFREARSGRINRLAKKRKAVTIYDPMLLDPILEAARLQAQGVKIPAVPPQ